MRTRALLAVAAALGMVVTFGTVAAAAPPPCPGVVETGPLRYRLASDTTCDLGLFANGSSVNLAGHTLTTGSAAHTGTVVGASDLTLRNGSLRGYSIDWSGANGVLDHVDASAVDPATATGFFIQVAGPGFKVTRSHFHDLPTALDLYYVGQTTISDSTFTGNVTAVAVQKKEQFTIVKSTFTGNGTGLFLRNEDGIGVNDVLVADNRFEDNTGAGIEIRLRKGIPPFDTRALDNVQITGNRMARNGGPGLDVTVTCPSEADCVLGHSSIAATSNTIRQNGFAPPAELGNDGISARTLVGPDSSTAVVGTAGLSVLTLTGNVANKNADRGIDAAGVTDGGGNSAHGNTTAGCLGVVCS
jgi:hypothetical protein